MAIQRGSQPGIWLTDAFREMGVDVNALLHILPGEAGRLIEQPESATADDLNSVLLACEEQTADKHFGLHLIESIELYSQGDLFSDSIYKINSFGEDNWFTVELSAEAEGDVRFIDELRKKVAAAKSEDEST